MNIAGFTGSKTDLSRGAIIHGGNEKFEIDLNKYDNRFVSISRDITEYDYVPTEFLNGNLWLEYDIRKYESKEWYTESQYSNGKGSYNSFARSRDGESAIEYYDRIANGTLLDKGWYKYNDFLEKQLKNIKKIK